jgi:serine/threonine protein kinase
MHAGGIRHQDIEPSNIIQKGDDIYFTDFSLSSTSEAGRTTSTENPSRTSYMYSAPEVTAKLTGVRQRHGRASDIFALGCVLYDMWSVLTDWTVSSFHEFLLDGTIDTDKDHSSHRTNRGPLYYSHKTDLIQQWFSTSDFHQSILAPMLASDRDSRPSAPMVLQNLTAMEAYESCEYLVVVVVSGSETEPEKDRFYGEKSRSDVAELHGPSDGIERH